MKPSTNTQSGLDSTAAQSFTATGQPFKATSEQEKGQYARNSLSTAESWGSGPANLLPHRFTDESIISVPVLKAEAMDQPPAQKGRKPFWSSRKKLENAKFTTKQMPRKEYLMHYAKDNDGKYIGTEDPAEDCILRGEDLDKWRKGIGEFKNEVEASRPHQRGFAEEDGIIR